MINIIISYIMALIITLTINKYYYKYPTWHVLSVFIIFAMFHVIYVLAWVIIK